MTSNMSGVDGAPLGVILDRRVSASVRAILQLGLDTAEHASLSGLFGTGLMLVALYRYGLEQRSSAGHYAPARLYQLLAQQGAEALPKRMEEFLQEHGASEKKGSHPLRVSSNLQAVFEHAATLPSHDGILAARHLVFALLSYRPLDRTPSSAWQLLEGAGIDRLLVLRRFTTSLAQEGLELERAGWAARLAQLGDEPRRRGPLLPAFGVDAATGRATDDCLDLEETIGAMASLIASPQLDGNLSLGVFGNWGSGKSFFMRRLRGAIDELSEHARARGDIDTSQPLSCWPNILQAEFNAWHYVDANLWASLVTHLLEELRKFQPARTGNQAPAQLQTALANLQIAADSRDEAARVKSEADKAYEQAKESQQRAANDVEDAVNALARESALSAWELVPPELRSEAEQLAKPLAQIGVQLDRAHGELSGLYAALNEVGSTSGRLTAALSAVLRSPRGALRVWTLVAVMSLPMAALLLWTSLGRTSWLSSGSAWLGTFLSSAALGFGQLLTWLRRGMQLLEPIDRVRRKIELALQRAEQEKTRKVARVEKELALREATLRAAQQEVLARETQLSAAVQAVGDALSGRAITRFVEQRIASSDYHKHLGIVNLIRGDFEHLSRLVAAHNAQRLRLHEQVEEIQRTVLSARPELTASELEGLFANLGVNRIVLYIDDLDRCPSERVVEVLQAIHLLLAFPLFVVVVGVDARWVSQCLATEYPALLAAAGGLQAGAARGVATSDYLEKIFQIPFWVPSLRTSAARALIRKLEPGSGASQPEPSGAQPLSQHGGPQQPAGEQPAQAPATQARSSSEPSHAPRRSERQEHGPAATLPTPLEARPLVLTQSELVAMHQLAAVIGRSPRATKRFVNSYRLLKAALTHEEVGQLGCDDRDLGGMAAPMLLLAVVTGAPVLAPVFLFGAEISDKDPVARLLSLCSDRCDTGRRVREFCTSHSDGWYGVDEQELARWVPRVSQFSFEDLFASALAQGMARV